MQHNSRVISPISTRVDLREHWDKGDCPLQKSIAALRDLVGLPVVINLETQKVWTELRELYPGQEGFVASIAGVVRIWTDCLTARLQNDANEAWTESLLEHIDRNGRQLTARVEVRTCPKLLLLLEWLPLRSIVSSIHLAR